MEEEQISNPSTSQPTGVSKSEEDTDKATLPKITGSCACNAITWTSTNLPTRGSFCYCSICRKISGGAFIAFMDLPLPSVTFKSLSQTLKVMSLSKNAERGFCTACGSTLTMRYFAMPETVYVTLASVDDRVGEGGEREDWWRALKKKHLYVGERVQWYALPDDGLPRFETMPNEAKYLVYKD